MVYRKKPAAIRVFNWRWRERISKWETCRPRPTTRTWAIFRGGLNSYGKAIQLLEGLNRSDPSNEEIQEELAVAYKRFGELNQEAGKPPIAVAGLKKSVAILERLCAGGNFKSKLQRFTGDYGGTRDRRAWLADTYTSTGDAVGSTVRSSQGDSEQAMAWYRKALALHETLAPNTDILLSMGALHSDIGGLLTDAGKNADAVAEYQKTLAIKLRRKAMGADTMVDRRELAIAYHNVAVGLLGTKDYPPRWRIFRRPRRCSVLWRLQTRRTRTFGSLSPTTRAGPQGLFIISTTTRIP